MDDNKTNSLDMEEFKKACKDYRIGLSEEEVKVVFNNFDKRGDGTINYEEFLREIRVNITLRLIIIIIATSKRIQIEFNSRSF